MSVYFVHQMKHNKTTDVWDKGIVVKSDPTKNNEDEALQAYHAYLGAYAYGHDPNIDYCRCRVDEMNNIRDPLEETWIAPIEEQEVINND